MILLSITGLFRTLLILIGAFVLLRFLGQIMMARRDQAESDAMQAQKRQLEKEKRQKAKNLGKTNILDSKSSPDAIQDVDFEEVED